MYIDSGTVRVTDTNIYSNQAYGRGGGIFQEGGRLILVSCRVHGNAAGSGGAGGFLGAGGNAEVRGNTKFFDNSVTSGVGANVHVPGTVMLVFFPLLLLWTLGAASHNTPPLYRTVCWRTIVA